MHTMTGLPTYLPMQKTKWLLREHGEQDAFLYRMPVTCIAHNKRLWPPCSARTSSQFIADADPTKPKHVPFTHEHQL